MGISWKMPTFHCNSWYKPLPHQVLSFKIVHIKRFCSLLSIYFMPNPILMYLAFTTGLHQVFPGGTVGKEFACQCRRHKRCKFNPLVRSILWRRKWQPTPVFLPGKFYGQRSLVGYKSHDPRVRLNWGLTDLYRSRFPG